MGKRLAYFLLSFGVGMVPSLATWAFTGKFSSALALGLGTSCSSLFLLFCERTGKVKSIEEIDRPLTLFPRDLPR
jgi:hypothetical protein